eukprot:2873020-Amphidinium_carterae.1
MTAPADKKFYRTTVADLLQACALRSVAWWCYEVHTSLVLPKEIHGHLHAVIIDILLPERQPYCYAALLLTHPRLKGKGVPKNSCNCTDSRMMPLCHMFAS